MAEDYADTTTYEGFKLSGRLFCEDLQLARKDCYRMKDLCQLLETTETTVKTWEKKGWFPKPRRDPHSNYRIYDEEEMGELKRVFGERARRFRGKA